MWTYFFGQYGDLRQRENFERCLNAMLHYKHISFLNPDPDRIRREFWQGEETYARLFALFQEHYAERRGKPRWGDQTALIERYSDLIFASYPRAKFIHMIRDPRDRYEASLALWPRGRGKVGGATARWLYSVALAKRNLKRHPERYTVVRYEDLVSQPETTLREICAFLDEEYTPTMLRMDGAPGHRNKFRGENGSGPGQCPVSTDFIGRFRQVMSKRDIAFMQAYAKRDMVAHGYRLERTRLSPPERLLFCCANWPLHTARLVAWRTLEALRHNFPAWIGRKPGSRMVNYS